MKTRRNNFHTFAGAAAARMPNAVNAKGCGSKCSLACVATKVYFFLFYINRINRQTCKCTYMHQQDKLGRHSVRQTLLTLAACRSNNRFKHMPGSRNKLPCTYICSYVWLWQINTIGVRSCSSTAAALAASMCVRARSFGVSPKA